MIEVDVFWSFAMGAQFALYAANQIQSERSLVVNWPFVYTVCFLSMLFAPSGTYLLNRFPAWETMFVWGRDSFGAVNWYDALLPTLFTMTNTLLGVIGFLAAARLIKKGRRFYAYHLCVTSYMGMFSILGLGYGRFLYAGNEADWNSKRPFSCGAWFTSEVFYSLLGMAPFFGPGLLYPTLFWQAQLGVAQLRTDLRNIVKIFASNMAVIAASYQCYLVFYGETERSRLVTHFGGCNDFPFTSKLGPYTPLFACLCINIVLGSLFLCGFTGLVTRKLIHDGAPQGARGASVGPPADKDE
eukprot:TRINITY_DN7094_c0_g1_i1.p1 TRINITY_DN7094_c0_g1~~TRINITY_DN7094_c0_g1_i1.p1  ORF type:complete len:299 (+),score=82.69 TRINITY_DN7094_c0_g1_i1:90-986(+)